MAIALPLLRPRQWVRQPPKKFPNQGLMPMATYKLHYTMSPSGLRQPRWESPAKPKSHLKELIHDPRRRPEPLSAAMALSSAQCHLR